jgi:hypothetical protein
VSDTALEFIDRRCKFETERNRAVKERGSDMRSIIYIVGLVVVVVFVARLLGLA